MGKKTTSWDKYSTFISIAAFVISCFAGYFSWSANEISKESNNIADTANIIARQANDTANYISKELLEIERERDKLQIEDHKGKEDDAKKEKIEHILSQANMLFDNKNYEEAFSKYKEYKKYRTNVRIGGERFETLSKNILAADPDSKEGKKYQQWSKQLLK